MKKKHLIIEPAARKSVLNELRNVKMARSAHAYVRGNTARFYEWLDSSEGTKLPQGPAVWIGGDCHVGNLGPIGNAKNKVDIAIRDLDQAVIGNPVHDLIRLGLSLASAARSSDLSGVITARMMEQMIDGYEQAFRRNDDAVEAPETAAVALKYATSRKWKHLARERIEDEQPTIPLSKRLWPLSTAERRAITDLFTQDDIHPLLGLNGKIDLLDAAYWVKGCSSLGNVRYAVLLRERKTGTLALMDVKEAVPALAPHYPKHGTPRDHAQRVVAGARALSPALGNRMLAASVLNHAVVIRELLPQDLKFEVERLSEQEAVIAARYFAHVVGLAHARQMNAATRARWRKELARNHTKSLDAPSWLWTSIVALMATHEAAYLDHCRRYAQSVPR